MSQDPQQQSIILRAIAVSSIYSPAFTPPDRQEAFKTLEELKRYEGKLGLAVQWILTERLDYQGHDITTPTKLLALEIITEFLNSTAKKQPGYSNSSEADRLQLRSSVIQAARMEAMQPSNGARILGKKLASVLEGIVVRDFPQRWTTFTSDVFSPLSAGGLWSDNSPAPELQQQQQHVGINICLECLKLIAEDCTDSDYNAKISTQRRNDVLIGLNEVSQTTFLPLLFRLLEQQYPILQQAKTNLHNMNTFLLQNNRTLSSMSSDEQAQYEAQLRVRQTTGKLIADTLVTLSRFCTSMPLVWMLNQETNKKKKDSSNKPDFVSAMMHLLRERDCEIQIRAAECIEELAVRGKLDFAQWMRFLAELPAAVNDANAMVGAQLELETALQRVRGGGDEPPDPLAAQVAFHKTLCSMLSSVVSSHVVHITSRRTILECKGSEFASLTNFLRLLVEMLHHPSGRICSEQINLWSMLLRDPQIAKTNLLPPYSQQILSCYMNQLVKVRWEDDVENETHPHYKVLEASYDGEEDYDAWMADLRSRSSLLFKFMGSSAPAISSELVRDRLKNCLAKHGTGQPLTFLNQSNQQLTQKSDAVIQLESMVQPFENILCGIPPWALSDQFTPPKDVQGTVRDVKIRSRAALGEFAQALVSWQPEYLWLRFRRASLLEGLKYYWKHDPSTLLQAVDSLIRYIGLQDEWRKPGSSSETMSGQTIGLKKKSGVSLVVIAKHIPQHLVPWLAELSNATSSLLSSPGLIPLNQMHLYEFLTCVAGAVEDPAARAGFVANVLSNPLETMTSQSVQQQIASPEALMAALGITKVGEDAQMATNIEYVKSVRDNYNNLFTALNRLLSVGKRCNEAARKRGVGIGGVQVAAQLAPSENSAQHFLDEGPVSLNDLAVNDPFAPLWPKILPSLLSLSHAVLAIWRPEYQSVLLGNPLQRYALAISDDEAYTSKNHDKNSGGVFGEGGTAGSVVSGADRRDLNLVPKWSGWLNELRNTIFQMFGLLAAGRALFAPELRDLYPSIVTAMVDVENLKAMEHRHLSHYLKQIGELMLLSCPSSLYETHLGPIIGPILEHTRYRLEYTWSPIVHPPQGAPLTRSSSEFTNALASQDCSQAASLAAKGGEEWFRWYYSHCGLFVGDLDKVTADAAVEKHRVDLSRVFSDVVQTALALKGDWALVLANRAKEEQAAKRNDASGLFTVPGNQVNNEGKQVNADGTPKSEQQALIDARKWIRINGLCQFLLLGNEGIAGNLVLTVIQCLGYPDAYTVRRITKICHRILETTASTPQYTDVLANRLFTQAVKNVATEPKWMVGLEWDMINVVRDIYCRLVLGQVLQTGGQGAAAQQPLVGSNPNHFEQTKTVNDPLHGGGILEVPSSIPRQVLANIPGIGAATVEQLEALLRAKRSAKDQKDAIRDMLRVASDNLKTIVQGGDDGLGAASGIFGRAAENESLLHTKTQQSAVPSLPEKLVTKSQVEKKNKKSKQAQPEGLAAFSL